MNDPTSPLSPVRRRTALAITATGTVTLAVGGCAARSDRQAPPSAAPSAVEGAGGGDAALAGLDQIPVGGGVILADQGVVLSRPVSDRVVGFSTVCTHAGCAVSAISSDTIDCRCHGSRFRLTDGSVASGPAPRPLDRVEVRVQDGQVRRA